MTDTIMSVRGIPVAHVKDIFKTVFLFAGRFQVPGRHHRMLVQTLSGIAGNIANTSLFPAEVVVWPVGRYDEQEVAVDAHHRRELVQLAFGDIPHVIFRMDDLEKAGELGYTPTVEQYDQLSYVPDQALRMMLRTRLAVPARLRQVFIVVGADNASKEKILTWEQGDWLFEEAPWIIFTRPGHVLTDAPPNRTELVVDLNGSASDIVARIRRGEPWEDLVANKAVEYYIKRHGLCRT